MPVVPFTARPNQSQPIPKANPTFLMMAAAELHEAGRLIEPSDAQREQYNQDRLDMITGEDADKEAFVKKHGVERAIEELDTEIEEHEGKHAPGTGGYEAHKELKTWRGRLQDRLTKPEDVGS